MYKRQVVWGSLIRSLVWLGRLMSKDISFLLGLNVLNDLAVGLVGMPLRVVTLEKAIDGGSTGRAVLFREIAIAIGQSSVGVVLGVLSLLGFPLISGFLLALPFALSPLLVINYKELR